MQATTAEPVAAPVEAVTPRLKVWKFEIGALGEAIDMPVGARVLSVAAQAERLCVWALVDPLVAELRPRRFVVAGTGHAIDPKGLGAFVGTVLLYEGTLVLHVWEAA